MVTQIVPHAVFLLALNSGRALLSLLQMKTVPGLSSGLELIEPFLRIKWAWTPAYLATGMPTASGPITTSFILFLNRENKLLEKILRFLLALKFLPLINPSSSSVFVTRTLVAMSICTSYTLLFRVGRLVSSVLGTDYL